MPCASCVNFNRECCVYDRWVPSSSSRPKQETTTPVSRTYSWADPTTTSTTQPTSPCFTSKVVLTKVLQKHQQQYQHCYPVAPPSLLLQAPFMPQSYTPISTDNSGLTHSFSSSSLSSTHSLVASPSWKSSFDSPSSLHSTPLSPPVEPMMPTVSLSDFLNRPWTSQDDHHSPILDASPSSQSLIPMDSLTQSSTSSNSTPSSPSESHSRQTSPPSFATPTEFQSYSDLLYSQGEKETQDLLQNVDALLMHIGNP